MYFLPLGGFKTVACKCSYRGLFSFGNYLSLVSQSETKLIFQLTSKLTMILKCLLFFCCCSKLILKRLSEFEIGYGISYETIYAILWYMYISTIFSSHVTHHRLWVVIGAKPPLMWLTHFWLCCSKDFTIKHYYTFILINSLLFHQMKHWEFIWRVISPLNTIH